MFRALRNKTRIYAITVRVVSEEEYIEWLNEAKIKFAKEPIEDKNKLIASK